MGDDGHLALSDFGLAKDFGNFSLDDVSMRTASFVGSPFYVAPDVLKQKQYTYVIDYWSFGILVFRMLVGRPPFLGRSMKEVFDNILYQELRFSQSNPIDEVAMDIISKLLKKEPAQRLQKDPARAHEFWTSGDHPIVWDDVLAKKGGMPEGWQPPEQLNLEQLAAEASQGAGSPDSPRAVTNTPANQGPLAKDDQELFAGFTYQEEGSPVAAEK